ncbi:hypothetical protein IF2G_02433 [Cordyceps javanica]|nr:hypothetical protein IF2G_02433 [Cordyceps javanica]
MAVEGETKGLLRKDENAWVKCSLTDWWKDSRDSRDSTLPVLQLGGGAKRPRAAANGVDGRRGDDELRLRGKLSSPNHAHCLPRWLCDATTAPLQPSPCGMSRGGLRCDRQAGRTAGRTGDGECDDNEP